jgi:alcohol dehydrogenase
LGRLARVGEVLAAARVTLAVQVSVGENPGVEEVEIAAEAVRRTGCDVVVGLGGGSALDGAKLAAMLAANDADLRTFLDRSSPRRAPAGALPLILAPTTAGSGSEATRYAIVTDPRTGHKPGLSHPCLYAREVIVDPELAATCPPAVGRAAGFDAILHALEAYLSKAANPWTDSLAERVLALAPGAAVAGDWTTLSAAATLGGMAIDGAGVGLAHALAHPLGGRYGWSHGLALAAVAVAVAEFNAEACGPRARRAAGLVSASLEAGPIPLSPMAGDGSEVRLGDAAGDDLTLPRVLKGLLDRLGFDLDPLRRSVPEKDVDLLVGDTLTYMTTPLSLNQRPVTPDDLSALYRAALGRRDQ